jgi:hypothetical protein
MRERFTHHLPFNADEVLFMAAVADVVLQDAELFTTFSTVQDFKEEGSLARFRAKLGTFVEKAEQRRKQVEISSIE